MRAATPSWPAAMPRFRVDCCEIDQLPSGSARNPFTVRKIAEHLAPLMSFVRVAIGLVLILAIVGYSAFSVITTGQVLGIDARRFHVKYQGLDMRLTGVEESRVVQDVIA